VIIVEKTLQEIRDAETHAEKILAEAREKASVILSKGKSDAEAFITERKNHILTEKAESLALKKKELEKEQQKFLKKAEKEADNLAGSADSQCKKVLASLTKDFKAMIRQ
jgi:vacuolar-type H+-ATPase subunit H